MHQVNVAIRDLSGWRIAISVGEQYSVREFRVSNISIV